jgi:small subunit ribosomal protein S4
MGRYIGADCKSCRRSGAKLFLKGTRCATPKCAIERRNYPPGSHRPKRGSLSDYAIRLKEKQKAKNIYGILEKQFRRYFRLAKKQKGITGLNLLRLLEMRLDSAVYNLGLALSRDQARQIARHGHICVNGRKVNIPSFIVKTGDVVEVGPKAKEYSIFKDNLEMTKERTIPGWLEFDRNNLKGKVIRIPAREDITVPVQENLIVELYSR